MKRQLLILEHQLKCFARLKKTKQTISKSNLCQRSCTKLFNSCEMIPLMQAYKLGKFLEIPNDFVN